MPVPAFTVVVPAYNASATIESCLRSVRLQSFEDFELIVVDDGSRDATPAIVERHARRDPRIRLLRQANAGVSSARNCGIGAGRGARVSFLDADDLWLPRYLEQVDRRLAASPDAGLAYADSWALLDPGKLVHRQTALESMPRVVPDEAPRNCLESLLTVNFITTSSVTVTRAALDRVGGFAVEMRTCEDWDLWLRIAAAGYRCTLAAQEPLVLSRETSTSTSKDAEAMAEGACVAISRALERSGAASSTAALAARRLAELEADLEHLRRPGPRQAAAAGVRAAVRPLKRSLLRRWTWRRPGPEPREALRAVGEI